MHSFNRLILTAALLAVAGTSSPALATGDYDHLKCFKIRDSLVDRRTIYLADLFPNAPFDNRRDCRLRLPALHFCVNVAKSNVEVGGELVYFRILPEDGAIVFGLRFTAYKGDSESHLERFLEDALMPPPDI